MSEDKSKALEWKRECEVCGGEGKVERRDMPLHHMHSEAPEYAVTGCGECEGNGWLWTDEPCTLAQCRPGPFMFEGSLGFKTEYGAMRGKDIGCGNVDWQVTHYAEAFCMDSGEVFWGGAKTHEARDALLVYPVEQLTVATPTGGL